MTYIAKPRLHHPSLVKNKAGYTRRDYEGAVSTLCAGCGHDSISAAIIQASYELDVLPHQIAKLSGIGCSSKSPTYFLGASHGFNTVHGRMPSVMTGANLANRNLVYMGVSGDGDSASIGLGQFAHIMRRGVNMTYIVMNNGVYGLTKGLLARGGPARVFNTLLDEQTILGLALGAASMGLLPVPEIQYLAYLHNAEDQLRGEAATMTFFSDGKLRNPMVVRVAGFAYQKGFGGHFHNDNAIAVLRDIPGLIVAVPARGDDAMALLRAAFSLARQAGRIVVIIEPIALYHARDLHEDGDGAFAAPVPTGSAAFGRARLYPSDAGDGANPRSTDALPDALPDDLTIASYGNGLWMSLRVARRLRAVHGLAVRVLDLRWLVPLPLDDVLEHAAATGKLLVVDECRASGGVSEAIATAVLERGQAADAVPVRFARVTAADSFVPLGDAANLVLVSEAEIEAAALKLCGG